MRADPKTLVSRLNPTCNRMLEAAVGRGSTAQHYEIGVEHMLLAILDNPQSDVAGLLDHYEIPRGKLLVAVERSVERLRAGNPGRPVFSEALFQWLEDAWVLASLEYGATQIRSGHLLLQFLTLGHRYTASVPPVLSTIPADTVRREFIALTKESPEDPPPSDPEGRPAQPAAASDANAAALEQFTTSLTTAAREDALDPIFGREREIRQLTEILVRRRKNNPVIVGEPGVGKTALAEGLALSIAAGDVPTQLRGVDLRNLDMGLLQAGAGVRGEFERRLRGVIDGVKASPTPIVLFIDEAHTLIGSAKDHDAANLLKPALARGELRTIAATTWSEYKKYFEKDAALARRFQPVHVEEPSDENALVMLRGLRGVYEQAHGVTIRDEALEAAVHLSRRYIAGRQLPDKAVDLLDTAGARVRMQQEARPQALIRVEQHVEALTRQLDGLSAEQRDGYAIPAERIDELNAAREAARDKLATTEARWNEEREALAAVRSAREALRGASENGQGDPDGALQRAVDSAAAHAAELGGEQPLIHGEVDADAVAEVVSSWTSIPVGKMRSSTLEALLTLEERLTERVKGQPDAVRVVAQTLRNARAGIQSERAPLGVLLLVGTSGVGKTEMATALADILYGGERFMTTLAMSEFQEKHMTSRLIGSPPGYVGYGEGGLLTEAVRQRPHSVVLLDECEKADPDVMNLFYQVFDKGTLTDGEGLEVDFRNTVIILTSNLASDIVMRMYEDGLPLTRAAVSEAIRPTLTRHFKPALLNRMSVVPFVPLPQDVLKDIAGLKLGRLAARVEARHGIAIEFSDELRASLAARCTDSDAGARGIDHVLRDSLMPTISRRLLEEMAAGNEHSRLAVSLDVESGWALDFSA